LIAPSIPDVAVRAPRPIVKFAVGRDDSTYWTGSIEFIPDGAID
jgi:hypothetical protein